jgi:fibronectin type 3 domain-containing protein
MNTLGPISVRGRAQTALVVLLLIVPMAISMFAGAYYDHPDAKTGAPGEGTCQACHDNYAVNSDNGNIMVAGIPEYYECGESYTLTVTVYCPGKIRFCFEMTTIAEVEGHPAGSFTCLDMVKTCVSGKYIKTTKQGYDGSTDSKSWDVQWNAPSMAQSAITFYAVGLGSNCDNDEDGDRTYTCMMRSGPSPKTPDRPKGIVVEPGDGIVQLCWYMPTMPDPAGGEVLYRVYWSDSATGGLDLLTTVDEPNFVHTGLANGHTYRYQVMGVNDIGEGQMSDVVYGKPDLVPDRPRHITASGITKEGVQLSWDAPTDWGTGGSRSYTLYRGEVPWDVALIEAGITSMTYTDNNDLAPNGTYHYRVVAVTSQGAGGVATMSVFVPPTTPGFPLDLSVSVKRGTVELIWQPPAEDGGASITCYRVYRAEPGKEPITLKDRLDGCAYTDTSVEDDVTYEYTVAALNSAGVGTLSTPVEALIVPPPTAGDTAGVNFAGVPFSGMVVVGAVIIIGALMVARLSSTASKKERDARD